ncbi:MAG TPA: biotin--[acetyl-CoA-carboxylase] ligase [Candidatus Binatia bacterium]|nr:biotin--[acetyl-CoA-carboxylase] ligase [Candidatus Binatia bacterium]
MAADDSDSNAAPPLQEGRPLQLEQVQNGLGTERLGRKFHYFFELDSTNLHARGLAERGAADGEIVIAEQQSRGRGRSGRVWVSPPYVNLYFSVVLRPKLRPQDAPQITLTAAVALAEAVDAFSPTPSVIKWPNDILIDGRKLAGILVEASSTADRVDYLILGIGINLNFPLESMPPGIRERATSLLALRRQSVNREAFLRRLIQDLDRCYGTLEDCGFGAIAPRWQSRFGLKGKRVRVEILEEVFFGTVTGIDPQGALILRGEDGKLQRVIAGDVIPSPG